MQPFQAWWVRCGPFPRVGPPWGHGMAAAGLDYAIFAYANSLPAGCAEGSQVLLRCHSRPRAKPHRRAQPLQSEAGNAKNALETAIPGVLRTRPAPIDSIWPKTPHFGSGARR